MDSSDLYVGASVQAVYGVKKRTIILTLHGIFAHFAYVARENQALTKWDVHVSLCSFCPLVIGYCFWWSVFFILSSWQGGKTDSWCRYWAWFFFSSIHLFNWSSFMFDVSGKFEYCFFQKSNNRGFAWGDPQTNSSDSWQWVWLWWINHELG